MAASSSPFSHQRSSQSLLALQNTANVAVAAVFGQAQLLVKTVTSYHVGVLKFSPFEPDHFVSAGRDNIRCYRMKGDEIRGISIQMKVRALRDALGVRGSGGWTMGV